MRYQRVPLLASLVVLLAAAACTTGRDGATSAPSTAPAPSATPATTASATGAPATAPPAPTPPQAAGDWRVTYGWAVPSSPARVAHTVRVPVTPAPGEPLPVLVQIHVCDHPAENFSRITFAFRGPTAGYQVAYVPRVESDGSGAPVALPGNAFLSVRFHPAQGHDSAGRNTVNAPAPGGRLPDAARMGSRRRLRGIPQLRPRGVQTTGGRLPVRLAESTRPDGAHVVSVDVRRS